MSEEIRKVRNPVRQLLALCAVLAIGHLCHGTFRFTISALNSIFLYAYFLLPFLAIHPVLRLRRRYKALGLILLTPVLFISSIFILMQSVPSRTEIIQPLQTIQLDRSTVELGRYHNGGAVGVLGVYLEQRRLIVPGLYLVRSIAWFDYAHEAGLSIEGPLSVRVYSVGSYDNIHSVTDKVYSLKPWVYF